MNLKKKLGELRTINFIFDIRLVSKLLINVQNIFQFFICGAFPPAKRTRRVTPHFFLATEGSACGYDPKKQKDCIFSLNLGFIIHFTYC